MRSMPRRATEDTAARPSRVFVHIGAPMSGAAFLRECLARHRRRLTRYGVLFPSSHLGHEGGHLDAVLDLLGLTGSGHGPSNGAWDRLAEIVRDWRRGTVVVSHELLADASTEQVERLVTSFGRAEVHVVYAAETLARQVPLAWQEWVHNGGTAPFSSYVNRVVARDPHRMSTVFWRSHDAAQVLARWAAAVPAERIHVLTVPPDDSRDRVLWERFAATVGIDARRMRAEADGQPRMLGLAENEVLRLLNVEAGRRSVTPALDRVRRALAPGSGSAPALPVVHAGWVRDETDRQLAAVKDGGYRLVGPVTDLMPDEDLFVASEQQMTPELRDVVAVQTRLVASLSGDAEGPAGLRRRALRALRPSGW